MELGVLALERRQEGDDEQQHRGVAGHQHEVLQPLEARVVVALEPSLLGGAVHDELVRLTEPDARAGSSALRSLFSRT